MSNTVSIRCMKCGTITTNSDYCSNCGTIINTLLKRKLDQEKIIQQRLQEDSEKKPGRLENFMERALKHPNIFVKLFSQAIYGLWAFFGMLIGALLAAVMSIAAG